MTLHKNLEAVHTPLKKALRTGQQIVEIGSTAKGIWDIGSSIFRGIRSLTPIAQSVAGLL